MNSQCSITEKQKYMRNHLKNRFHKKKKQFFHPFQDKTVQLLVYLCMEKIQSPYLIKRKEILKEHTVGWQDKVTLMVKSFIALHVIIAFYIIRSIDHICKAVSQLTLTQLRNFNLPCDFRVFRSAYLGFMSLNHSRTSKSVALPEQK